ncbi:adenylyl-sulfate kinase [Gilvimarinus sp. SDUM040013]|uniref:Adenylyl-sulfate kinase n=1 Tax=Gilvimarinus gilvus TaxID=3058038 RepID=A0ABU4RSV5_9GAMM|nr:adenylyl-sulfate kinase [Gilvimarinus sp. SDUM040013]MDO3388430.1 adenylyl-sulfate kinase [Gilvimarinus sp. SDUM040013]MDX6847980.1 adenylyl-sulfate kinase [Gilvimarinus sp. SDUM040013]
MSKSDTPYELKDINLPSNAVWHKCTVSAGDRADLLQQVPRCIWLTGLSGSGKSTIANALDATLHANGIKSFLLDGDNVRHGLNKDLGMTENDRAENIRRVGEVAKLMVDAGLVVICAFISPYKRDRQMVRSMFKHGQFMEAYLDTPLAICEDRDPKGLYKKARAGVIKQFTGISDPYEKPENPEIVIDTSKLSVSEGVRQVLSALAQ